MLYTYKEYKDVHTIWNTGLVPLTYRIERIECDTTTLASEGDIAVGETKVLPIKAVDGIYRVTLSDSVVEAVLPDIEYYNNLLLSFLRSAEEVLCGSCKDCNDCDDCNTCETYLNAITKGQAYLYVNSPKYDALFESTVASLNCLYTQEVLCAITNEFITGNEDVKNIFLLIIATHYQAFYHKDFEDAEDAEEEDYVNVKYNVSKISKCIRKIGVNIQEITTPPGGDPSGPFNNIFTNVFL